MIARIRTLLFCVALLGANACSEDSRSADEQRDNSLGAEPSAPPSASAPPKEAGTKNRPEPTAYIAVNELRRALLPLAPQLGQVLLRGQCVVFEARGAQATILWPYGTTLQESGDRLAVRLPTGELIEVPSSAGLTGAHVPLNSANMTKFSGRLHPDCPNDVFAARGD